MRKFLPEGSIINEAENIRCISDEARLYEAMAEGRILEARAKLCDSRHNIIVDLPCMPGMIPRIEGAAGIEDGSVRDIALISRVGKPVCFRVISIEQDERGGRRAVLSRRAVQEECKKSYISLLSPGDIIPARVTHLEQFGAFVDIGSGISSLVPIDAISVSRISHPSDRFSVGQDIRVIIKNVDESRVWLSHKELLGTWEENASFFTAGETVSGIVRSVEDYGIFVELTPNLAGLAEVKPGASVGQGASVYIKAINPDKMKIKLVIVDLFDRDSTPSPLHYFYDKDHISEWRYSSEISDKIIESRF